MKPFEGLLLLTDLDGTLLQNDKSISKENLQAIEHFTEQGGTFSIVSGRAVAGMTSVLNILQPKVPIGCLNGAGIYDFTSNQMLSAVTLPNEVLSLVAHVDKTLPQIGIEVFTLDQVWFCKQNVYTEKHRTDEYLPLLTCPYDEIRDPIVKILFTAEAEDMPELVKALRAHPDADLYHFVRSDKNYFEILPHGIDKSVSVHELAALLHFDLDHIITVGDNDNDIAMLAAVKHSYAVANASENAKAAATYVTVSNQDHAIASIVAELEQKKL